MAERIIKKIKDYTGPATCKKYDFVANLDIQSNTSSAYERAAATKDIIRLVLKKEKDISELKDLVSQGIQSMYALDETNDAKIIQETNDLYRYLSNETRTPHFVNKEIVKVMENKDTDEELFIEISPDAVFVDGNTVEAVIYKASVPKINDRTGIREDKVDNIKEWLNLWVLEKYAKAYAEKNLKLSKGDVYEVKGSFYYMKKSTDKSLARDNDFFSGSGGNIVSLEDKYVFDGIQDKTETDLLFEKFIRQCDAGIDACENDCDYCNGRATCKYAKAPIKSQKKQLEKRKTVEYSAEQLEVINAKEGLIKVNATAGSGKTEVVTERSVRIVLDEIGKGLSPEDALGKILHISFTEAAVGEMKTRILGKLLERDITVSADDVECYTFNGFANRAIGEYYKELGFSEPPAILTAEFELNIIEKLLQRNKIRGIDPNSVTYTGQIAVETIIFTAQKMFEIIKSKCIDVTDPDSLEEIIDYLRENGTYKTMHQESVEDLMKLYEEYDKILKSENFVTYSDQEPLMFKVLELHPDYFAGLGYEHIVIDEFQDSNEIQVETAKMLRKTATSVMFVGDDSQAIYAFRDTTPEYIIHLEKYMGEAVKELNLSKNYRSVGNIISLANGVIDLNTEKIDKKMEAVRESGNKPIIKGFYDDTTEYEYIADSIEKLIKEGVNPKDICFEASNKTELTKMGTYLTKKGISWVRKNPMDLMEDSRILGAMALADAFYQPEATINYFIYLSALYDGEIFELLSPDEINLKIADLKATFEVMDLREFEEQRAIFHGYLDRLKEVVEDELYDYFLSLLYKNKDLVSELEYTRIFKKYGVKMAKRMDQSYEGVVLTTIHSSKGLEWPYVFISLSKFDDKKYHKKSKRCLAEKEERRRLLFVALTRARDNLVITGKYVAYGPKDDRVYNQFLKELFDIAGVTKEYIPVDPDEAIKEAEAAKKRKERARERYASKKAERIHLGNGAPLTDEEKKQFDKLTKGARQMTLAF